MSKPLLKLGSARTVKFGYKQPIMTSPTTWSNTTGDNKATFGMSITAEPNTNIHVGSIWQPFSAGLDSGLGLFTNTSGGIIINFEQAIKIYSLKYSIEVGGGWTVFKLTVYGSNDGENWNEVGYLWPIDPKYGILNEQHEAAEIDIIKEEKAYRVSIQLDPQSIDFYKFYKLHISPGEYPASSPYRFSLIKSIDLSDTAYLVDKAEDNLSIAVPDENILEYENQTFEDEAEPLKPLKKVVYTGTDTFGLVGDENLTIVGF